MSNALRPLGRIRLQNVKRATDNKHVISCMQYAEYEEGE